MLKKVSLLVFVLFLFYVTFRSKKSFADVSSKRSYSDVNFNTLKSTFMNSSGNNSGYTFASTGVVSLLGIGVSSPGVNSRVVVTDNWFDGISSNTIDRSQTNVVNTWISYQVETTTGLVVTSTCQACSSSWTSPDLRVSYERKR